MRGTVRYDGTDFAGWQVQSHARTVQGELERVFSRIASQPIRIQGASRTDAGVHALGQVFSCHWPGPVPHTLRHAVSMMLSPEIRVTELAEAAPEFNARFSALSKRYVYTLDLQREPDPLCARYAWHVPYALDLDLMRTLLPKLEGDHDFAGFQSTGSQTKTTVRTILEARLIEGGGFTPFAGTNLWRLEFHGNAFLYRMVRNITGTLVEIARGRFEAAFFEECLASPGPFRGHCAPAHGLALASVDYD